MKKKLLLVLLVLSLLVFFGGSYIYYRFNAILTKKISPTTHFLVLEKGMNSQKLANFLASQGIISASDAKFLPYLLRLRSDLNQFKAGVYSSEKLDNVEALLKHFCMGKEVQLSMQLLEGKTFKNLQAQFKQTDYLQQTIANQSEAEIATLLGLPYDKLEGWIAPDTYNYVPYSSDLSLLKRAYEKQKNVLEKAWQNRQANLPLATPYEMLILASIVEKETSLAKERPLVASVMINRLRLKMKLQTDPTVIYGMAERYNGNIRKKDLEEATLYNTYVIEGLPPTPIAMPSEASINAVSQPDESDYLYFVADGSGGHKFSRNLAEHNQAVRQWIEIERNKKIGNK